MTTINRYRVQVIYLPRPCGCSTPVCAIRTKRTTDTIQITSHIRVVNKCCAGPTPGVTKVTGWLSVREWLDRQPTNSQTLALKIYLKRQCVAHKERVPRIPESFLI